MEESSLQLYSVIGFTQKPNCMLIHPSQQFLIFSVGSQIVIKNLDSNYINDGNEVRQEFLSGHANQICFLA